MSRLPLRAPILSPAAAGLTIVAGLAPARTCILGAAGIMALYAYGITL